MRIPQLAGRIMRPAVIPGVILLMRFLVAALVLGPSTGSLAAENIYQSPNDFLASVFGGTAPKPKMLWLRGPMRNEIKRILGHPYPGVRIRYWSRGRRTAWILEEIGKYKPITAGIAVHEGRIQRVKVLIYRESHGWEVRYPFFTNQFKDITLTHDRELSHGIDGISGATLSVNALTRLTTLALHLNERVVDEQ